MPGWSTKRKLPPGPQLLAEWRGGATYEAIAAKYGLSGPGGRGTAYQGLRRYCERAGLGWPLPDRGEVFALKRARTHHAATLSSIGVALVVADYIEQSRTPLRVFCREHNLGHSHLYRIMRGETKRVTPHYALHLYRICGETPPDWLVQKARDQDAGKEPRVRSHVLGQARAS